MPKRIVSGKDTRQRIEEEWENITSLKNRKITITSFCKNVKITTTSLYHNYPDWAEKIRLWIDEGRTTPRKQTHMTKKRLSDSDAIQLIERLRKELSNTQKQLTEVTNQRDIYKKRSKDYEDMKTENDKLRALLQGLYGTFIRELGHKKAQEILSKFERTFTK